MSEYENDMEEEKKSAGGNPVLVIPRRAPTSLHEARLMTTSVRVGVGRYRVVSSPLYVSSNPPQASLPQLRPPSPTMTIDNRPRRPRIAVGHGEKLGKPVVPPTQFSKIVELLPSKVTKKRVYFPEDDLPVEEPTSPAKKKYPVRIIKRIDVSRYKKYPGGYDMPGTSSDHGDQKGMHQHQSSSLDNKESLLMDDGEEDYVEEVVDVMDEECAPQMMPPLDLLRGLRAEHGLPSMGQLGLVKQLRGENNYLKDQLDASVYRIKQLENLLMDRNQRLKQLLSENVQLSVKVKKLTEELGTDAAAEALAH